MTLTLKNMFRVQEVVSSNLTAPTIFSAGIRLTLPRRLVAP
jgi:hypothetical protein